MAETIKKAVTKKERSYWIKIALVLFIQIFFRFLPNIGPITDFGMTVVGIFIGTLVGWCMCDTIWPSISCLILLGLTGYGSITDLAVKMLGNSSVMLVLLTFIFGGIMMATGISDWLGQWILSRKFLKGRPVLLTFFILLTMYIVGALVGLPLLILLWELVYSIARQAHMDRDNNKWPSLMVFSLLYFVAAGFYFSWYSSAIGTIGIAQAVDKSLRLDAWPFLGYGLIVSALMMSTCIVGNFLVYRPDISALKNIIIEEPPKINKKQKVMLYLVLLFIILMIVPSALPGTTGVAGWLKQYGSVGMLLVCVAIALLIRVDGKPLVTMQEASAKGIIWGPIFLMGTAMVVAGALTSKDTGVNAAMAALFTPIFGGMSPFAFVATLIVITVVLTNFINNLVVVTLFVPIVYAMKDVIGINPVPLVMILMYSCNLAVLLPSANPMTALMFGETDKIKSTDIFKYSAVAIVTGIIVLIFVAYPLASAIYG